MQRLFYRSEKKEAAMAPFLVMNLFLVFETLVKVVTQVAGNDISSQQRSPDHAVCIRQHSINRNTRQASAQVICAVTACALVFTVIPDKVFVIIITLALDPVGIIDRVHTVRPIKRSIREAVGLVVDCAFFDGAGMTL